MKTLILSSLFFLCAVSFAQETPCSKGDCQNGYGFYYNKETGEMYHGFFKDGKYNGVGYTENKAHDYWWSNFKDGKIDGFTVYDEGEGRTWGVFEQGVKIGDHVREVRGDGGVQRELIAYDNGKEISRKMYTHQQITESTCISGDCNNGFGMYYSQRKLVIGKFVKSLFLVGEMYHVDSNSSDFFMPPNEVELNTPYFKVVLEPTDNGVNEYGYIAIGPEANGEYVLINAKQNLFAAAIFKDNQVVDRY
tara:strand:+ start:350 stop:1096 length:747 start_codon:yes stop_codon:yes gene_type:complete